MYLAQKVVAFIVRHVGLGQDGVEIGAYYADRCLELVRDVVGELALELVFLFGCLEGYDMLAFAAHVCLYARVVYGHDLARYVADLVGGEVAHRYEVAV